MLRRVRLGRAVWSRKIRGVVLLASHRFVFILGKQLSTIFRGKSDQLGPCFLFGLMMAGQPGLFLLFLYHNLSEFTGVGGYVASLVTIFYSTSVCEKFLTLSIVDKCIEIRPFLAEIYEYENSTNFHHQMSI